MKLGSSEKVLAENLQNFQTRQLKEVENFIAGFESAYKLFEKSNFGIPTHIKETSLNLLELKTFLESFKVEIVWLEFHPTSISITWKTTPDSEPSCFDSSKANAKQLMYVLNQIGRELAAIATKQKSTLVGNNFVPQPLEIVKNTAEAYERVVKDYVDSDE